MTGKAGAAIGVVATLVVLGIVATTSFRATGGMRADVHPGKTETTLANWVAGWYISHAAPRRLNPVAPSAANLKLGQTIFGADCAICHGFDGRGDGALGPYMNPPASDLTAKAAQQWTDAQLFWIIQHGMRFTGMPSWKASVNPRQTWLMVNFIRSLNSHQTGRH